MPLYEVHHSYPLDASQQQTLATAITHLHATTFTTPSSFVNVNFTACDASDATYFIAGKAQTAATNRITGRVRTSSSRTKADFDDLAAKLEAAWYDAVLGEVMTEGKSQGKRKLEEEKDMTASSKEATKLLSVAFVPLVTVRELGLVIPEAGGEAAWVKENMGLFKEKADQGDENIADFIKELGTREDLKGWTKGGVLDGVKNLVMSDGKKEKEKEEEKDK